MTGRERIGRLVLVLLIFSCTFNFCTVESVHAATKLPSKLYKLVKGKWYTQASSGGYNIKFTKTRVKYYDRKSDKLVHSGKILKVKKLKKGRYRIVFKNANGISSFVSQDKKASGFDCFSGASGHEGYSGGSSLTRGKWSM